jgi:hypothetical protein
VTTWVVDLLGVGVSVTVWSDHLADPLGPALADLVADPVSGPPVVHDVHLLGPDAHGRTHLRDGAEVVAADVEEDLAVAWLLWYLNRLAATTPHRVTIHAGAVAGPHGAVVLPGAPGAGKSTMTAALVRAGCGYLSDELAALDLEGRLVHPFPRPLALHPATVARVGAGGVPPAGAVARPGRDGGVLAPPRAFGATLAGPTPPAAIVMPRIVSGAPGRPRPLAPPTVLLGLLAHAPNLALLGTPAFVALATLAARCPGAGLEFDDPAPAAASVVALGGPPAGGVDTVRALDRRPDLRRGPARGSDTDAVRFGAGDVVIHDRRTGAAHHLNGPAAEVYTRCDGRPEDALVADLVTTYADPTVASDVRAVLTRLRDLHLIS